MTIYNLLVTDTYQVQDVLKLPDMSLNGVHPLVTIVMLLKVRTCLEPVSDYMYSKIKYSIRRVTLTCTWQHKNK